MKGKLNVLISGGTGTGKTTTLNAVSAFIPGDERIVTIEDAAELQLQQEHVITLESRPSNIEGSGEIKIRELVRNALRMRPDRIIVGEVRGAETLDMLQAMNTGHEGSLTTIHANSPRDALSRLETLVMTGGVELPHRAIREQIASAFDLLIQIQRLVDGSRRVTHITEVLGMESDVVTMQDIFVARTADRGGGLLRRPPAALAAPRDRPQAALPREARGEQRRAPADVLLRRRPRSAARVVRGRRLRRCLRVSVGSCAAGGFASYRSRLPHSWSRRRRRRPCASSRVDTSGFPAVRLTVVAPLNAVTPRLTENAAPVAGYSAVNLGGQKAIVLALDRSQSMRGRPLRQRR